MQQDVVLQFSSRDGFTGTLRSFTSPGDQVAFERHFGVGLGRLEEEKRAEWVLWLIWRAWDRETKAGVEFEAFLDDLSDYDLPTGDADPEAGGPPG